MLFFVGYLWANKWSLDHYRLMIKMITMVAIGNEMVVHKHHQNRVIVIKPNLYLKHPASPLN